MIEIYIEKKQIIGECSSKSGKITWSEEKCHRKTGWGSILKDVKNNERKISRTLAYLSVSITHSMLQQSLNKS